MKVFLGAKDDSFAPGLLHDFLKLQPWGESVKTALA